MDTPPGVSSDAPPAPGSEAHAAGIGHEPATTGMRVRCRGAAVTATSSPRRKCAAGVGDAHVGDRARPAGAGRPTGGRACSARVRPLVTAGSFLLGPSTTISSTRPIAGPVAWQGGALDDDAEALEPLGHDVAAGTNSSTRSAASVPGRGE